MRRPDDDDVIAAPEVAVELPQDEHTQRRLAKRIDEMLSELRVCGASIIHVEELGEPGKPFAVLAKIDGIDDAVLIDPDGYLAPLMKFMRQQSAR